MNLNPFDTGRQNPDGSPVMTWQAPENNLWNMFTGETDFQRNMALSAYENQLNRENMQLSNAFTAEREDLAYARNKADMLDLRAYEENLANTEMQRKVADMKAAGLNPWMAANGAGSSVPSGNLAGATSASSATVPGVNMPESHIWQNTASSIKTAIASAISLIMLGKVLKTGKVSKVVGLLKP